MLSKIDELKAKLAITDREIRQVQRDITWRQKRIDALYSAEDTLHAQRIWLEAQLELATGQRTLGEEPTPEQQRADAVLIRPEGYSDIAVTPDGVVWRI